MKKEGKNLHPLGLIFGISLALFGLMGGYLLSLKDTLQFWFRKRRK